MRTIISLVNGVAGDINRRFATPINFELQEGEHLAVIGLNGSGKSTLIQTITGQLFLREGKLSFDFGPDAHRYNSENIRYVTFNDAYGTATADYYYQQRWNSQDSDQGPRVEDILGREKCDDTAWKAHLYDLLGIDKMLDKPIIMLSSGELRKMHIARLLLSAPKVLILEALPRSRLPLAPTAGRVAATAHRRGIGADNSCRYRTARHSAVHHPRLRNRCDAMRRKMHRTGIPYARDHHGPPCSHQQPKD